MISRVFRSLRYRKNRFSFRFTGDDTDIDLEAHDPPEFCAWQWVDPEQVPELIVPFKKRVYRTVVEAFRELV